MAAEKSKSDQLERKVREIAPEKADKVLTRYQKVQEGLHDALFGEEAGDKISAAEAGLKRLEEMENELLAKGAKREALVSNFDAELGSIADSLGIGLRVEAAIDAVDKEAAEKDVKYYFGQIDANLYDYIGRKAGIASQEKFVQSYLSRRSDRRTDAKNIASSFSSTIPYFHEASESGRMVVKNSYFKIKKALMLFINGRSSEANKILWGIKTQIDGAKIIEADLLSKLQAEKEKMAAAQKQHLEACKSMKLLVEKDDGGDPIRKAQAQEKMLSTLKELLTKADGFVKLREDFVVFGPNGEDFKDAREAVFVELVGENLRSINSMSVKVVEVETKVVNTDEIDPGRFFMTKTEKTVKAPKLVARDKIVFIENGKELETRIEDTNLALLSVRRDLFLMTGDERLREDFEKGQEKINQDTKSGALKDVEAASDGTPGMQAEVNKEIELMAIQFAEIQKTQGDDPLEALKQNTYFLKGLYDLRERLGCPIVGMVINVPALHPLAAINGLKGTSLDQFPFANLEKDSPALHEAFVAAIDRYIGLSHQMQIADIFGKDPIFVQHIKGMVDFAKETKSFIDDFTHLMKAKATGVGKFSADKMAQIRQRIAAFRLGTGIFANAAPMARKVFDRLKEYEPLIVGMVPGFEDEFKRFQQQFDSMEKMRVQTCQVMNFLDQADGDFELSWKKFRYYLSKLAAGVIVAAAVAAAITAMFVPGGQLVSVMFVGAFAGAGGYLGFVGQSQLVDDRPEEFTAEGLATAAAFGAAFGAAGKYIGAPFGRALGRFAQRTNVKLAALTPPAWMGGGGKIVVDMLKKFGERGLNRQAQQLLTQFAEHGFVREIPKELLQEIFDDILEHFGKVIAPHHPWVGFMLQVLAGGMQHAKTVKINATFSINEDVTVSMTDSSVSFEFSDKVRALEALRQHGAPAEVIIAFEANGFVNAVKDGVTIIVRPSNEPVVVRQLLANQNGQNAALLAGLRFNEADPNTGLSEGYTFEGSPEMLIAKLEGEFLVETTPEGDIIATDLAGNKIRFTFANKHLGLEVAGLLNSGLELDENRQPTITRAENVLPVLGELSQMGFKLERSANGIVAKKDGQTDVEISLDQAVAAEVAEGGRSILELAAALNEDTDGFAAGMLARLNGAKSKVGEALLWAGTKTQVELQSLMGRIGRALEARANRSVAANLAVPGGLSLLTSGCSVKETTEWYFDQLLNHGFERGVAVGFISYALFHGGLAAILKALAPPAVKGAWWLVKAPFLLGKFAFSKSFRSEIDASQPGISVQPSRPTKAELDLGNLGDLSVESQTSFDAAFSQLNKVFAGLRFAVPMVSKPETLAKQDGTRETKTVLVPDTDAAKAKAQEMFNDIMRLIFLSLRKADIEAGRATVTQPQTAQGQPGFRQQRGAVVLLQKPTLNPDQELQNINKRLGTAIGELLTQNLTDIQTLSILASVRADVKKNAMAVVDSFLTSKNIDPKSAEGLAIRAEINRIFKVLRDCKPDSTFRQLTLAEARRDAMLPSRERSARRLLKLAVGSGKTLQNEQIQASQKLERLLGKGLKKLNAKEQAEFDKALSDLISFFKTAGLNSSEQVILAEIGADMARFDTIVAAHKALMKELGRIKSSLSPIWPESRRSRAIGATALVVALTTALGYAGAAMFGGDDEAAAAEGAAGGSSEGTNVLPDDTAQPSREKAVEGDKVIADAASEGNQAALDRAAETLKALYLRAKARLDATKEGDPTKAAKEAEVKRLENQLRKNRIDPDTVKPENNQPGIENNQPGIENNQPGIENNQQAPVIAPQSDPAAPDAAVTPEADGAEPVSPKASNLDEGI